MRDVTDRLEPGHGEAARAHRQALAGETVEFDHTWEGRTLHARVEPLRGPAGDILGTIALAREMDDGARHKREELLRAGHYDALT